MRFFTRLKIVYNDSEKYHKIEQDSITRFKIFHSEAE